MPSTSPAKRTVSTSDEHKLEATWRTQLATPLKDKLAYTYLTPSTAADRRVSSYSAVESVVTSLSSATRAGFSPPPPPPKVFTEVDLSNAQIKRLKELYADYCQQAALRGTAEYEVIAELLGRVDPSLLDAQDQLARLRACGYNPMQSPVMPFPVLLKYALKSPAIMDPPLPKDEQETIDAFVCLGGNRDKSGFITTDTLRGVLENFKIMLDVQALLDEVDTDGSGTVEFEEFDVFYRKKKRRLVEAAKVVSTTAVQDESDGESEEDDTITRTLSMNSNEAYKMLSNILLFGDPDDDGWEIRGVNLERLRRQQEEEDRNNKYILDDDEPSSPLTVPTRRSSASMTQQPHITSLTIETYAASPMAMSAAEGGVRAPRGVHFSPPATPGVHRQPLSPQGLNAMNSLNLSFNDAPSSFASSQNFASPTASINNGSLAMSMGLGSSMSGRRRATTVRREKTAAALLTDAMNGVLDIHGAKLREVGQRHNNLTSKQQHFVFFEEVDHVTELAVASVDRARRLSEIHERQVSRFNERVDQKRGSDFGVTPPLPSSGTPVMAPTSRPASAKIGPTPAPPPTFNNGRPLSASQRRPSVTPPHFELPRNCIYSVPKSLQAYDDSQPKQLPQRRLSASVPHYAQPKGPNAASVAALQQAQKASEELNARSRHLFRKMAHADRKCEAAHRIIRSNEDLRVAHDDEVAEGKDTMKIVNKSAYEEEIPVDEGEGDEEPLNKQDTNSFPPKICDLIQGTHPNLNKPQRPNSRPTTAPLYRRQLQQPGIAAFGATSQDKESVLVAQVPAAPKTLRRPMTAQNRPTLSAGDAPRRTKTLFLGRDFYSAFAASAPLSARRAANAAAALQASRPASVAPSRTKFS